MELYQAAFGDSRIRCVLPLPEEQRAHMEGIYEGVKAGRVEIARERFGSVGRALHRRHGGLPVVMVRTEIPLALPFVDEAREWTLVDPADVLALALTRGASDCGPHPACACHCRACRPGSGDMNKAGASAPHCMKRFVSQAYTSRPARCPPCMAPSI